MADLADYEWLTSPAAADVLAATASSSDAVHRQLERLRKTLSAERAGLVVKQIELRRRAVAKFGDLASRMFFTDVALQQATDLWTARCKATRIPLGSSVNDYCCGIGGDLLALAERGATTGWDRAPEVTHLANANLVAAALSDESWARIGDVASQNPEVDRIWHLDPDRRKGGQRSTQLHWHSPGPELVDTWLTNNPNGIVKLAPATEIPTSWQDSAEREWITYDRQCRQQVAWFGKLATVAGQHRATVVTNTNDVVDGNQRSSSFVGSPDVEPPQSANVARYVYDTDPSVRAAHLTGAFAVQCGLSALSKGASYLTSDNAIQHPLLACFEVTDELPLRTGALSKHLRGQRIGHLEIKKRGVDADPERLRQQLKLRGENSATLLLCRVGTREVALLARRIEG